MGRSDSRELEVGTGLMVQFSWPRVRDFLERSTLTVSEPVRAATREKEQV